MRMAIVAFSFEPVGYMLCTIQGIMEREGLRSELFGKIFALT
jgi:hypothetical protein